MKNQLLFISAFLLSFNFSQAQDDYIPIIKENAYWYVINEPSAGFLQYPVFEVRSLSFGFRGDTIINQLAYKKFWHKLYSRERWDEMPHWELYENGHIEEGVMAYMREDIAERKVYAIYTGDDYIGQCKSNEEILIYDFDIGVGDTIQTTCMLFNMPEYEVESQKEVDFFGKSCKQYILYPLVEANYLPTDLIEGMGSPFGPIGPHYTTYVVAEGNISLVDYCEGEEGDCLERQITSTKQTTSSTEIKIHPNPSKDFINISIPENHQANKVQVFDQLGRMIIEQELDLFESAHRVDCNGLDNGMYIVKVSTEEGDILVGKFLKTY